MRTSLLLLFLALSTLATAQETADLEVLSVVPAKEAAMTDETFRLTVRIRNHGPGEAKGVVLKVGVSLLSFMTDVTASAGWTCEQGPVFDYAVRCSTPALAADTEAEVSLTLASPQHSAMTYRLGGVIESATQDPSSENNRREKAVAIVGSETHAELALSATAAANQAKVEVRNSGPHDARGVMVVLKGENGSAVAGSGKGWRCGAPGPRVSCTLPRLRAGMSSTLTAQTAAPPAGGPSTIHARVRADRIREESTRDNGATVTLPAP